MPRALAVVTAAALTLALAGPAAADRTIVRDSHVDRLYSNGGTVVYHRDVKSKRAWMRVGKGGKSRRLRHLPRGADVSDIGRDRRGRLVLTLATGPPDESARHWIYDLRRERARRLRGLPRTCYIGQVSLSRRLLAYTATCPDPADSGIFLRRGKQTERVSPTVDDRIVLRGRSLASLGEDGNGDLRVFRLVNRGRVCPKLVRASYGAGDSDWHPHDVELSGGRIVWVPSFDVDPSFALLAARAGGPCGKVGRTGIYQWHPATARVIAIAIDGRNAFYTNGKRIVRHRLAAHPSFAPPVNDDFADAIAIPQDLPKVITGRGGHATLEAGEEPLDGSRRTLWYSFRPPADEMFYVDIGFKSEVGVFTGSSLATLQRVAPHPSGQYTAVDGKAGQTYWIAVGTGAVPDYELFQLNVTLEAPPLQ